MTDNTNSSESQKQPTGETQRIIEQLLEQSRILRKKNEELIAELNESKTNPAILWSRD
ncbi:hypothetical protein DYBT9275_03045 [Dyadobacter sp. CECT 9275]|uniref:Uncharacterized protein n=1 Tax=Dyadobacter helix TaxID=2822344 RepID=A0A916JDB2_9BACT|nr:hypothetical protein [Dyadobacter sp. CECT 9275]CAG5003079.1 hypothetical protein DYBT9275_03045 [Dyadobacter sp. CECT 9275]